jgi:RNA polymerase sigma-70 factor (ECF subfamily)
VTLPPDEVLVERLRNGDDAAFGLLLDAWSSGMLRLARSFVPTPETAADVVQETWLAVVQGIGSFQGRSSLRTWVYRILVNTAKRRGQRERRVVPMSSFENDDSGPTVDPARFQGPQEPYPGHWREFPPAWPAPSSPEQKALDGEVRGVLAEALELLPERQRTVITLRDVEGYESDEVCAMLEITAANQRVLLHRARAFVRGRLEQYYASVSQEVSP